MRLGFRGRLMLGTTLLVVTFVTTAVVVLSIQAGDFAEKELARSIAVGRESLLAMIAQRRDALRDGTRLLSRNPPLIATTAIPGVDQATLEDAFDEIQRDFSTPLLLVVDTRGRVIGNRGGDFAPGKDLGEMPGMAEALRGAVVEHVWPQDHGLVMVGLAPITQGELLLGVLVRGERLDQAAAQRIGEVIAHDIVLVHDGRLLADSWRGAWPETVDLSALTELQHAQIPPLGLQRTIEIDGKPRPGLAVRLHPDAGIAFLPHDTDAILRLRDEALSLLLVVGGLLALLGIAFAARTASRLTRPLRQLIAASNLLRGGDLTARVDAGSDDELRQLAESFNAMAETMQTLIADVTDKAMRAEAANRAKDGFLMSISHELRTPLTGIQSNAELLLQFGDDASPEERSDFLDTILQESERLGRRISDALEFANLASGRAQWTVTRVDPFASCESACRRLDSLRSLKSVGVFLEPHSPIELQGDRERITEAVYHLVHNAWTWSPEGSEVEISLAVVSLGVTITVADRGPGISPSERKRIFDYFTQGGDTLTDKPQGIGIGLKIASEVARAHGGEVDYRDRPGGGAVFSLLLRTMDRPIDQFATEGATETAPETCS